MKRNIIRIDEEKCDGCGLCAEACVEGAIAMIDGKARLVNEAHCDGLGACVGQCPRGAITVEEREVPPFAPPEHALGKTPAPDRGFLVEEEAGDGQYPVNARLEGEPAGPAEKEDGESPSVEGLSHWPIQLRLVSPRAPFLRGARLVVAADCTAFALPDFHRRILGNRALIIACPKLDDTEGYAEKLAEIIRAGGIREITAVIMEVPCCFGLLRLLQRATEEAGDEVKLMYSIVSRRGEILKEGEIPKAEPSRYQGAGK